MSGVRLSKIGASVLVNIRCEFVSEIDCSIHAILRAGIYNCLHSRKLERLGDKTCNEWSLPLLKFFKNESGATAIEYGLIAALIAVAIIGAISAVGDSVSTTFDEVSTAIDGV